MTFHGNTDFNDPIFRERAGRERSKAILQFFRGIVSFLHL